MYCINPPVTSNKVRLATPRRLKQLFVIRRVDGTTPQFALSRLEFVWRCATKSVYTRRMWLCTCIVGDRVDQWRLRPKRIQPDRTSQMPKLKLGLYGVTYPTLGKCVENPLVFKRIAVCRFLYWSRWCRSRRGRKKGARDSDRVSDAYKKSMHSKKKSRITRKYFCKVSQRSADY